MTLNCRICSKEFSSLLIPQEKALKDLVNNVAAHCSKEHGKVVQTFQVDMARIGALAMGIGLLNKICAIPATETFINESIEKDTKKLMEVLGYVEEKSDSGVASSGELFGNAPRAEAD